MDAKNKSGADFFQAAFRYPTHWKYIIIYMCENSAQFQYVWVYIDSLLIYMTVKQEIDDKIQSKK